MKKLFLSLGLFCSVGLHAQQTAVAPKLSAYTRAYMEAAKQLGKYERVPNYVYKKINNKPYLSALIKVGPDMEQARLDAIGAFVGTKAGAIWTVQVPIEKVPEFVLISGIRYIDLDVPVYPTLDAARKATKADSAQMGISLPMPMSGAGVITGIIDAGFDFGHATFYDTTHSAYRVKKVWSQKVAGTPPAGFSYGNEMTDSNVIRAAGHDTTITSHGSHVAGITAGSGYGSYTNNRRFRGMAYESDLVFVGIMPAPEQWAVAGEADIVDGMNYIYSYATSVGKPVVVNLSWGSTIGPHDGNSLFSQACDALTGAGKLFVCAAGNNGEDTVHLQKAFSPTNNTVSTFVTMSPYLDTTNQRTWVDMWGDSSKPFCINVKLYNGATPVDSTGNICIADTSHTYHLIGSNGDTCFVTVNMLATEYNGKPHAILYFYSKVHDNICLTTTATDGVVDMWEGYVLPPTGYYGALKNLGYSWATSGDANMTVSDIGSTRSAITVGAYTSKANFVNINGAGLSYPGAVVGRIAPFSSFGPTADYRIKPDITAPGFALASAVNSFDTSYNTTGDNYIGVISAYNDPVSSRTYRYAMLAGTSMAAPAVSGIVAMMLQLDPALTPDGAKNIINTTAIKDTYTGTLPASGTTTWGHGKINAYYALRYMAGTVSVSNTLTKDPLDCILYPNPAHDGFTIDYVSKASEQLTVEVFDLAGRLVSTNSWLVNSGRNSRHFAANYAKGVYLTKVSSGSGSMVIKTVME